MIAFELAVRTRPDLEFLNADALRHQRDPPGRSWSLSAEIFFGRERVRFNVIPDAVFALRSKVVNKCAYFFLERDRATMTVDNPDLSQSSFRRKLLGYSLALTSNQHSERFGFQNARVLTVTTSRERIQSMLRALRTVTKTPTGRFLFADWPSLKNVDPLTFPWLTNAAPARITMPA
jgi:hypothetical protein